MIVTSIDKDARFIPSKYLWVPIDTFMYVLSSTNTGLEIIAAKKDTLDPTSFGVFIGNNVKKIYKSKEPNLFKAINLFEESPQLQNYSDYHSFISDSALLTMKKKRISKRQLGILSNMKRKIRAKNKFEAFIIIQAYFSTANAERRTSFFKEYFENKDQYKT